MAELKQLDLLKLDIIFDDKYRKPLAEYDPLSAEDELPRLASLRQIEFNMFTNSHAVFASRHLGHMFPSRVVLNISYSMLRCDVCGHRNVPRLKWPTQISCTSNLVTPWRQCPKRIRSNLWRSAMMCIDFEALSF